MADHRWPIIWNARWIWSGPPPRTVPHILSNARLPSEAANRFCYLRRSFELDSVPATAPARITADSRFILFVNGREVARGPARSIPARLAWNEVDLAQHLRVGRNALAALVRFYGVPIAWWLPAWPSNELGMGSFGFESTVLKIGSDESWKAKDAPYRTGLSGPRNFHSQPIEMLDGSGVPLGWTEADFDDSSWDNAYELSAGSWSSNRKQIPTEPFVAPEPDRIAPLTAIPVALSEVSRRSAQAAISTDPRESYPRADATGDGPDTMATYDAGFMTLATPWLEVRGPRGASVDLYVGEERRTDGSAEPGMRGYAARYLLSGNGRERFDAFDAVGFRYLTAIARGGAELTAAGAIERRYPRHDAAHFECDDLRLNKIWRVGVRTLELCATDAFLDCPGREQRAWVGDAYVHALLSMVSNSDWRLVRRNLRIGAHSQRADGILGMVSAGDATQSGTTIPEYSLHWVRALARYCEYSGDQATTRELSPTALEVLNAFERYRGADGLIRRMPGWAFVDWAMVDHGDVNGTVDALYAAALDDFAAVADWLGDSREATEVHERAERTRQAFELLWDEARGLYVDSADEHGPRRRVSQHCNAMAIVGGCAPRSRWAGILDRILDESRVTLTPSMGDNFNAYVSQRLNPADYGPFDPERNIVAAQPFFSHFVHEAIVRAGRRDLIADRCLKWWPQIERGNSTFEEYWDAPPAAGSRCHAWSATPTYCLTAYVLGMRPLKHGCDEIEIAPLFGPLEHLEGVVPTPHGLVEVTLDRARGGSIVIPAGITARVRFDDARLSGGTLSAGRRVINPM